MKKQIYLFAAFFAVYLFDSQVILSKDPHFGNNGKYSISLLPDENICTLTEPSIYLSSDHCFYIIYDTGSENHPKLSLVKLKKDGHPETYFGDNGKIALPGYDYNSGGRIYLLNHKSDGFLIVYSNHGLGGESTIIRYKNDGSIDTSFGTNGVITNVQSGGTTSSLPKTYFIQSDHSILYYNGFSKLRKYSDSGTFINESDFENSDKYPFALRNNNFYWLDYGYFGNFMLLKTDLYGNVSIGFGNNGETEFFGYQQNKPLISKKIDFYNGENLFCIATQYMNDERKNWIYSVTSDGMLNAEFNNSGILPIEDPDLEFTDGIFTDGKFLISGKLKTSENHFQPVIYAVNSNGNLLNINSQPFYTEAGTEGSFRKIIEQDNSIYVLATEKEAGNNIISITKYNTSGKLQTQESSLSNIRVSNPFSDTLKIYGLKNDSTIEMYDLSGKLVLQTHQSQINTSMLSSGNYLLKIMDRNDSKTFKMIKE